VVRVVRKELEPGSQDKRAEAELLFLLGSLRHPNIVELLTCYTQRNITNLLFLPADFDLHNLLLGRDRPEHFQSDFAFFNAMKGLAGGLAYLHNFRPRPEPSGARSQVTMHGYHHDIKPRNILVRGTDFILADFGTSRLKDVQEDTKTAWKDTTYEYGAPECRDPRSFLPGIVSRAIDIWSLACVFAEVAVYMAKGTDGVSEFRQARVHGGEYGPLRCFHNGGTLSHDTDSYLQSIENSDTFSSMDELVPLLKKAFRSNPKNRPTAEDIESELSHITIRSAVQTLQRAVEIDLKTEAASAGNSVFLTRMSLEYNRLLAWGGSLGLTPILLKRKDYDRQVQVYNSNFYSTLKSAYTALACGTQFERTEDNRDFRLNTLRQANDELLKPLSDQSRVSIDKTFCILTAHNHTVRSLQEIAATDFAAEEVGEIGSVAAMKYMSILLERQENASFESPRLQASLIRKDCKPTDLSLRPETFYYSYGHQEGEEQKTLIEFIPYWEKKIPDSRSAEFHQAIESMFRRVSDLVAVLRAHPRPSELRVLNCLGACHDPHNKRFQLVFAFPAEDTLPVRLNKLLQHGRSRLLNPAFGQKLLLAKTLVASLQSVHILGWVHKSLSSLIVLLFPVIESHWETIDFSAPYLVGFDYSRKSKGGEYTQGPTLKESFREYLHPDYRLKRAVARRSHDYYSMGLLLLEIGLWISLSNIYDHERYSQHSPDALREEYIALCNRDLARVMGLLYQKAVLKCLLFESREAEDDEAEADIEQIQRDQLEFQSDVVDPINKCFEMSAGLGFQI
jgi:serine/threonine protein kinase